MLDSLFQITNLSLFFLLTFVFVTISIVAVMLISRHMPLKIRYQDNAVLGNISALISIIYGVLVGLMALYLLNNITYTTDAVQREANALADIYRDSRWLNSPAKENIQTNIIKYIDYVINTEWPEMRVGSIDDEKGNFLIFNITDQMIHYKAKTGADDLLLHDMLDEVKAFWDARQLRIHMSYAALHSEIWVVIFIGTFLIMMINFIYGINFYLHLLTVAAVALMASSMIFLLIALDRPFQGEFTVTPDPFRTLKLFIIKSNKINSSPVASHG